MGVPPVIIHFNRIFPYKPSILVYPHLWKTLYHHAVFARCTAPPAQGAGRSILDHLQKAPSARLITLKTESAGRNCFAILLLVLTLVRPVCSLKGSLITFTCCFNISFASTRANPVFPRKLQTTHVDCPSMKTMPFNNIVHSPQYLFWWLGVQTPVPPFRLGFLSPKSGQISPWQAFKPECIDNTWIYMDIYDISILCTVAVAPEARRAWQISSLFSIMIRDTTAENSQSWKLYGLVQPSILKKKHTEVSDSSWGYPQETPPYSILGFSTINHPAIGGTPHGLGHLHTPGHRWAFHPLFSTSGNWTPKGSTKSGQAWKGDPGCRNCRCANSCLNKKLPQRCATGEQSDVMFVPSGCSWRCFLSDGPLMIYEIFYSNQKWEFVSQLR